MFVCLEDQPVLDSFQHFFLWHFSDISGNQIRPEINSCHTLGPAVAAQSEEGREFPDLQAKA